MKGFLEVLKRKNCYQGRSLHLERGRSLVRCLMLYRAGRVFIRHAFMLVTATVILVLTECRDRLDCLARAKAQKSALQSEHLRAQQRQQRYAKD